MSKIKKIFEYMVIGRGIRGVCAAIWRRIKMIPFKIKDFWKRFWIQTERIIGLPARNLLRAKTPIQKNKVFFFTQEFRYGCNPKYVCEELLKQNLDIDVVWRVNNNIKSGMPSNVRTVEAGSYAFYKEIYSSNIVVANSYIFLDQALFLKKKQTLIQTWHGSLGIKKFGTKEMKGNWRRKWASVETGKMSTYCITNSSFVSGSLRNTYWKKTPMLEYGHPRNDLFFDNYKEKREQIRAEFCKEHKIDPDYHFVMYGPTFRDSHSFKCYDIDFDRLTMALNARFGGKWCILLRYHPSLLKIYKKLMVSTSACKSKIINVTNYVDMQELISMADIAITDYSSWIYDFMLLRRPGFIFATDIDLYNNERGFCYPLETTPFPISVDNDSLEKSILTFDQDLYNQRLEEFLVDKGCVEDGHASERVVKLIKQIIGIKDTTESTESDADEDDEDIATRKLQEKLKIIESHQLKTGNPYSLYYIKGSKKTAGLNIVTDRTKFVKINDIYSKEIYLEKGDEIEIAKQLIYQDGNIEQGESLCYSNIGEDYRDIVDCSNDCLLIKYDGIYSFKFDARKKVLSINHKYKDASNLDYYLNGNFNKHINWDGVLNDVFIFENNEYDNFAIKKNVYLKAGSQFYIVGLPSNSKNRNGGFSINSDYLIVSPYAEPFSHSNKTIRVLNTGFYNIKIDKYSNLITIEKIEI